MTFIKGKNNKNHHKLYLFRLPDCDVRLFVQNVELKIFFCGNSTLIQKPKHYMKYISESYHILLQRWILSKVDNSQKLLFSLL